MSKICTWPSRRLQFGIIAVLVIGAALRVFCPPLTREGRAEKLYTDSWFTNGFSAFTSRENPKSEKITIQKLEAALKLSPDNSLYQQALVFRYPREKLPELLNHRKFGAEARRLAAGLIYERQSGLTQPGYMNKRITAPEALGRELEKLDLLAKADPSNSLVHYRKAFILKDMGRMDEAIGEVRTANRLGITRYYVPDIITEPVLDASCSPMLTISFNGKYTKYRELARVLADIAGRRLREGKSEEACALLEDCCRMGVNAASSEPRNTISVLVGKAVFAIGWVKLEPIYKDFGMKDRLAVLQHAEKIFDRAMETYRSQDMYSELMAQMMKTVTIPIVLSVAAGIALVLIIINLLLWLPAAIIRRRRGDTALTAAPWGEGWPARMFIAINLPAMAAMLVLLFAKPTLLFTNDYSTPVYMYLALGGLILLAQLILAGVTLRILHHQYDEHTGEHTGILRFIFKAPAAAKAWTRKYVSAAFGMQLIFLMCCFLLATIVYKPIFGGHPWQAERFKIGFISKGRAIARQVAIDLKDTGLMNL